MVALLKTFILMLLHKTDIKLIFFTFTLPSDNIVCQGCLYGSDREGQPSSKKIPYFLRHQIFPSSIVAHLLNNKIQVITHNKLCPILSKVLSTFFATTWVWMLPPIITIKKSISTVLSCFVFFYLLTYYKL